jgi:hypothetical protein
MNEIMIWVLGSLIWAILWSIVVQALSVIVIVETISNKYLTLLITILGGPLVWVVVLLELDWRLIITKIWDTVKAGLVVTVYAIWDLISKQKD